MATAAKFPGALLALVDVGGEMAGFPEAVLSGAHNNSVTTITLTATVPTAWPTAGWVTIDSEIIQYGAKSGATLTGCTRGSQSAYGGSAAASHADAAKVGLYLTPQAWNQVVADLIAVQTRLGTSRTQYLFISASDCQTYGGGTVSALGPHPVIVFPDVSATGGALGSFIVPADFSSLTSVKALIHGPTTANMYLTTRQSYAYKSDGTQNYQNRSDSTAAGVVAMTANLVNAIDVSAMADALTPAIADIIGLQVVRDGTQGTDTINADVNFMGFLVTYVALY